MKCNMVISGTSVDSYRRRHSWHSLVFLPLPVCVSGIARARESRRINFARSLCRFRGRSIAYRVQLQHSISSSNIRPGKTVSSRLACGWKMAFGCRFPVALPCIELLRLYAVEDEREIRVRHSRWYGGLLVARRDQTTSVIKQQPTRRSGPCDHQIIRSFRRRHSHSRLPPDALNRPAILP